MNIDALLPHRASKRALRSGAVATDDERSVSILTGDRVVQKYRIP